MRIYSFVFASLLVFCHSATFASQYIQFIDEQNGFKVFYPSSWDRLSSPLPTVKLLIKNCFLCGHQEILSIVVDSAGEFRGKSADSYFKKNDPEKLVKSGIKTIYPDAKFVKSGKLNIGKYDAPYILSHYTLKKSDVRVGRALLQAYIIRGNFLYTVSWGSHQKYFDKMMPVFKRIISTFEFTNGKL